MKRIIISIANSFEQDRRMLRSAKALRDAGYDIKAIDKSSRTSPLAIESSADHITCWFSKGVWFYLEFNIRLFFHLIRSKGDVFLSVDSDTLLANTVASKIKGTPLVIDMHELFTEVPELADHPIKKRIWEWVEKVGIKQSSARYTVSKTIADQYETRYGKSFDIVRNVPLTNRAGQSILKPSRFTLIYLGAINLGRGLEELIMAVEKIEDVELVIHGSGDLDKEIHQLIERNDLANKIHFKGWINPDHISESLRKAHVGVNLLDPNSQSYYLSLANKYFDYIHAELPGISMNFPEYQSLNSMYRTSILIDNLSEPAIIDAILEMKNNHELYNELCTNCTAAIEAWNWQSESKRLISIFDF